ncbi:MAG TPA: mannitol dehydrogenase family protein [Acetobacteraceae bacterium]|jgi:mannitol-1-phosphate/altronate dehydrogenase|nr:mannitol dehydrogenase family protein [Acetobacteraceae bacterium]
MAVELRRDTLAQISAPVRLPHYDPARVTSGIVHLGLGNFHRAHMARYTHELMDRDASALAFGITGVGLQASDELNIATLSRQDGLYTLVERSGRDEAASIIGSIARPLYAGTDTGALLDALDDPAIRIVSLTVTENGYCLNASTRRLDPDHPLIRADLAKPARPKSAIGVIVEAYRRRMAARRPAFTALTCDNIQHNGNVLREAVLTVAKLHGVDGLPSWIEDHASFPNTMVDRITPRTAREDMTYLAATYGIADGWPVFAETFTQWVIEDQFVAGRPAWEEVGAQFVPDVTPYEIMKLRLLNGSHLAVAALGRLAGYTFIHETMANPLFTRFMAALMDRELGPTLPPVPGIDLGDYKRTLIARFANPAIRDTVERVNTDAPLNVLVVPIAARLEMDGSVDLLSLALAGWMRRVSGVDEQGKPIDVQHPLAAELRARAEQGGPDPMPLLGITQLFGDLARDERLVVPLRHWLGRLYAVGSRAALAEAAQTLRF